MDEVACPLLLKPDEHQEEMHYEAMKSNASYGAMAIVQLAYGGANILTKIALEKGLNQLVFVVYRHIIAMLLLGPFAYVLERLVILLMVSLQ